MRVSASAVADGGADSRNPIAYVLAWTLPVIALLIAGSFFLAQARESLIANSPQVRQAQEQQQIAQARAKTAELDRERQAAEADQRTADAWRPWLVGAENLAKVTLLLAIPTALVGLVVAGALLFRRHMSLPTVDGRVPLVGLDAQLSREALFRYQDLVASRNGAWSPLPEPRASRVFPADFNGGWALQPPAAEDRQEPAAADGAIRALP